MTIDELEALGAEALAVDIETGATQTAEGAAPAPEASAITAEEVQELASIITIAAALIAPPLPTVAALYSPETCAALARATLPVMRKHGWSLPGLMSKWGEEFAAAVVIVPLVLASYKAGKADFAAMEKAAENAPRLISDTAQAALTDKPEKSDHEPVFAIRG